MDLHAAGIAHGDPFGPSRLRHWLGSLRKTLPSPPAYIAVEFDQATFAAIKAQRPSFRRLASEAWPSASQSFIDLLAQAFGFEGDTHSLIYPEVNTLWLDQDRVLEDDFRADQYAQQRIDLYRRALPGGPALDSNGLIALSLTIWRSVDAPPRRDNRRDILFANHIYRETQESNAAWAIAIVGARHASSEEGSMVDLLVHNGIDCHVAQLRPLIGSA